MIIYKQLMVMIKAGCLIQRAFLYTTNYESQVLGTNILMPI